jgi:hypothetical protein
MGAIVIRTRYDEGTESVEVATSGQQVRRYFDHVIENGNDGHVILGLFFKR